MKRTLAVLALMFWAPLALALSPYFYGNKLAAGEIQAVMAQVESKLAQGGSMWSASMRPRDCPATAWWW